MKIYKYSVGVMGTNSYLVIDEKSAQGALIDPGDNAQKLIKAIKDKNCILKYVILTHVHFDHILALNEVIANTGASLLVHKDDADALKDENVNLLNRFSSLKIVFPEPDRLLSDSDLITLGSEDIKVLHTPGHTKGSICLICGDDIISGDTLFRESIGRYDFPGGDFDTIMASLKRITSLNLSGRIYPGHGMSTTLEHELNFNTYLM